VAASQLDFSDHPRDVPFRYLALGGGVQSSAVFLMACFGHHGVPRPDVAIFADTQDEPAWVYEHLVILKAIGEQHGLPLVITTKGKLSDHLLGKLRGERKSAPSIPVWTTTKTGLATPLRRHCTRDYKVHPLEKEVRRLLGYTRGQHMKHTAEAMLGISTDEASRMKDSRTKWVTLRYPLIDADLSREDCLAYHDAVGVQRARKSSCVYCPYHSMAFWRDLKAHEPQEWARAVAFDAQIRDLSAAGVESPCFLAKALKPLPDLTEDDFGDKTNGFINECEGHCGI